MSKCEHGEKINVFCASESCLWKESGGCPSCMKKYHNHMGPTIFITEDEAQNLIKKFNLDPSTKPKCRSLQEAIFNYFNQIKVQFSSFIDNSCMDIINQIGHPYLTQNGLLTTFKRIKKKDYKKIQQKEFKVFYEASQKVSQSELIENEKKIYIDKVKKKVDFINWLQKFMKGIDKQVGDSEQSYSFAHDGSINLKINEIVKAIMKSKGQSTLIESLHPSLLNQSQKNDLKSKAGDFRLTDKLEKIESSPLTEISDQSTGTKNSSSKKQQQLRFSQASQQNQKNRIFQKKSSYDEDKLDRFEKEKQLERQNQKLREQQKKSQEQKKRARVNSIDKHFIKANHFDRKKQIEKAVNDISLNSKIKPEHDKPEESPKQRGRPSKQKPQSSPKRRAFESKQVEINKKKQLLIDMMRQKQELSPQKIKLHEVLTSASKDVQQNKQSEHDSGFSFDHKEDGQQLDHTVIPIEQQKQRLFEDTEQVTQKTIIVPVQNKMQNTVDECVSPLLRYKLRTKDQDGPLATNSPPKSQINGKFQLQPRILSPPKIRSKELKQDSVELTDKQEKSIALLIKSIGVKAEEALPYLQSALQYADDNLSAAEYISYLYLELDRPKDCLTICNKVLEKIGASSISSQLSLHLNINKSAALNKLGRYSESIVILEECLKSKQNAKIYKNLGDSYFSIGIHEKSSYYYEKAVSLEHNYDEAYFNLAVCLFIQQNYHNAKYYIVKALACVGNKEEYLDLQREINLRVSEI